MWIVDAASGQIVVQTPDGHLRGTWTAQGVVEPEGITTDGVDIWIVDDATDSVSLYAGAARLLSGRRVGNQQFRLGHG